MILCLVASASISFYSWLRQEGYGHSDLTNRAVVAELRRKYNDFYGIKPRLKERSDVTPVEAFHRFANGDRVKFPGDTRPKDYKSVAPDPRKRPPRKVMKK